MPRMQDLEKSDVTESEVHAGDVWWVNFPYEEDEQKDENGDSLEGKNRPCLVLGKLNVNSERKILIVKGTTSSNPNYNDEEDFEYLGNLRLDCSRMASLAPHHLTEQIDHVNYNDERFQAIKTKALNKIKNKEASIVTAESANILSNYSLYNIGNSILTFVNESKQILNEMSGGGGPMIGLEVNDQSVGYSTPGMFITNYIQRNDFSDENEPDYAISDDIKSKYIWRRDKKTRKYIKEEYDEFFKDKNVRMYRFKGDPTLWHCLLSDIMSETESDENMYEYLSNKKQISEDQIEYDNDFEYLNPLVRILENGMMIATIENYNNSLYEFPVFSEVGEVFRDKFRDKPQWILKEDTKGYFIFDIIKGYRSKSFNESTLNVLLNE